MNNGDDVAINLFGNCIPDELSVVVTSEGQTLQALTVGSSCAGTTLLDEFGSLQFVEYACRGEANSHSCFTTVDLETAVANSGSTVAEITEWRLVCNGEAIIELPSPIELGPGQAVPLTETCEISLCEEGQNVIDSSAVGIGESGEICPDGETISFPISIGTPFPSPSPSEMPSPSPSEPPSDPPSPSPTVSPSQSPSNPPTILPSASPSEPPSPAPSIPPTTEFCEFGLDIDCVPPAGSATCNATPPPVQQCAGRPTEMGFLFNSGFCNESFNVQNNDGRNLFLCEDLQIGPTQEGEQAYIVIADTDFSTFYFEGWVGYREVFYASDGGNRFPANQIIRIYSDSDITNPANLIQDIQYHSSCSSNLFLKDRFGGVQLVEWVNDVQGTVSCFANQSFELDITIPIDIEGGPATVTGLVVASNVDPFFFNLTDQVAGTVVDAGGSFNVEVGIPIDLTTRMTYNLLITVDAVTRLGRLCRATELTSFTAGYPLPPIFPTLSPTASPTGTDSPTTDPNSTACSVDADISCNTFSGRSCVGITVPTSRVCLTENAPISLDFVYNGLINGQPIAGDQVFLEVAAEDRREEITAFRGIVSVGDGIRIANGLSEGYFYVTVSTVVNGGPGQEITNFEMETECFGSLTLGDQFGPLELISFETREQGLQVGTELVTVSYAVENVGLVSANLQSVLKTSSFTNPNGPTEQLSSSMPLLLQSGGAFQPPSDRVQIDLSAAQGAQFQFVLEASGVGAASGLGCQDLARYSFQV